MGGAAMARELITHAFYAQWRRLEGIGMAPWATVR